MGGLDQKMFWGWEEGEEGEEGEEEEGERRGSENPPPAAPPSQWGKFLEQP